MSESITGPIFYLLIAWWIVTAVFLVPVWRSLLESHEDDQIFLIQPRITWPGAQNLVAKINTLSRPILGSGIAAGACCC
jgi:hypothetical protein